jgi:hypothetical protein
MRSSAAPNLLRAVRLWHDADAHHMTAPCEDGEGAVRAMVNAHSQCAAERDDIDYINAHGTLHTLATSPRRWRYTAVSRATRLSSQ